MSRNLLAGMREVDSCGREQSDWFELENRAGVLVPFCLEERESSAETRKLLDHLPKLLRAAQDIDINESLKSFEVV